MTVSSTTNTTSTAGTTSGNQLAITKGSDLQNTFMQLLVAQLKNQDPLNPMDNSQMTSQLAQINTVNGIQQLNTTMSSMLTQNATTQASSMIGRSVQVPTNNLTLASGAANFGVSVPNGADDVVVTVTNAAGVAVRTVDLG
ncbi:flagellar hook assembly protein FlgD, partial [Escherichia coli]|nr:flagellar hook assembly protein FlgD [Escherichia coli]